MSEAAALLSDDSATNSASANGGANGNGAGATGQGANGAGGGANGTPASTPAWYEPFAQGLEEPQAKEWNQRAARYKDQTTFARSYLELRQNAIVLPKEDKPEAWNEVFKRLGRPEKAEEYKWNHLQDAPALDAGEQEVRNGFAPVAHRLGLSQRQVDGVVQWHDQQRKVGTDAMQAQAFTTQDTNLKTLRQEWGADYEKNRKLHGTAVKAYSNPQDFETLRSLRLADGTFALDHPAFARMFAKIGAERAEDDRYAGEFNSDSKTSALTEIAKIEGEAAAKGLYPTHPQWPHDVLKPLYNRAYGTKPIAVGAVIGR